MLHLVQEDGRAFVILFDGRAEYLNGEILRFINFLAPFYRRFVFRLTFQQLVPHLTLADSDTARLLERKYGIQ